jgi:hypothetical protein
VVWLFEGEYSEQSKQLAKYLQDQQRPPGLDNDEFRRFQRDSANFFVRGGHLFRKPTANRPSRRVIDNDAEKLRVLQAMHDDAGHFGRESTNQRVSDRYFWEGQYRDVKEFVKTCPECQFRESRRLHNAMFPTSVDMRWEQISVDCTPMPLSQGKRYLVEARSNMSGWVESRGIAAADSVTVAKFLYEEIICRHGLFRRLVHDGGPENKSWVKVLMERYGIKRILTSAYHPQANGQVEVGHKGVTNALSKMCQTDGGSTWMNHLHAVLWADRTTVKAGTGMTPYEIEFLDRPILPIELEITTWSVMNWDEVVDTTDLIAMRARALERRNEDLEEAAAHLNRMRRLGKEYFDRRHSLHPEPFEEGMLVLSHDTAGSMNMSAEKKLAFRWFGPFRIAGADPERGTYTLAELDGAQLRGTYAANRLKRFYARPADFLADATLLTATEEGELDTHQPRAPDLPWTENLRDFGDETALSPENEEPALRRSRRLKQRSSMPQPTTEGPRIVVEVPSVTDEMRRQYAGLDVRGESAEE